MSRQSRYELCKVADEKTVQSRMLFGMATVRSISIFTVL